MIRKQTKSEIEFEKIGLQLLIILVIVLLLVEVVTWDTKRFYYENYYSFVLGSGTWMIFTLYSQKIIDMNLFKRFAIIGLSIFILSLLKQLLTTINYSGLFFSAIPLIFIGWFKLLVIILYPPYPQVKKIPIIIMPSRYSVFWRGQDIDYKPTIREKVLSILLHIGIIVIFFGGVVVFGKLR